MFRGILFYLVIGGVAASIACGAPPAFAEKNVQSELEQRKAAQELLEKKAASLETEVTSLQSKLIKTSKELRESEEKLSSADIKLKELNSRKKETLQLLSKEQKSFGGMVTAAQKLKRTPTPHLLAQSHPVDAARAALLLKTLIPQVDARSALLKSRLVEIETIEASIGEELENHEAAFRKFNKKEGELLKLLEDRKSAWKQTESERKQQEADLKKLAAEAKNIDELMLKIKPMPKPKTLAAAKGLNLSEQKAEAVTQASATAIVGKTPPAGTLMPVHGDVRTAFGDTDDLGAKSKGITFMTRAGASVITPLSGTVRFAGPFQKYKQILIIEHKGGYHSLIAGLGRVDAVVGAKLAAGEPVGAAETSQSENRIYYELRQNGEPINPKKLLTAQRKQEKS